MKIYDVTFNDGGWYSAGGRPSFQVVAENKEEAIEKVLSHMAAKNAQGASTIPAIPPREITQKMQPSPANPAKNNQRFFETLRVITPNE
jgi:ribosomal protein L20A (L18A)